MGKPLDTSSCHAVLEEREYCKAEAYKTVVQLKATNGTLFVDVRKWGKRRGQDQFKASFKGIMLEIADWKIVIPMILELINCNTPSGNGA